MGFNGNVNKNSFAVLIIHHKITLPTQGYLIWRNGPRPFRQIFLYYNILKYNELQKDVYAIDIR